MKNRAAKKPEGQACVRRKAVNLYLSEHSIRQLKELQTALRRPSKSNVVDVLIEEAALKQKQAA